MNWLAHLLLSKDSVEYQLGNLLADPLKGRLWDGASKLVQEGFRMHCSIDSFTDSNSFVLKSKSRLGHKGYLKGVIVDIAYDHLLLNSWDEYCSIDIDTFLDVFYLKANNEIKKYPQKAKAFVQNIIKSKILTSYSTFEGLEASFKRIDKRLSNRILEKETAIEYIPILKINIEAMEDDFSEFFPLLVSHFRSKAECSLEGHWLK